MRTYLMLVFYVFCSSVSAGVLPVEPRFEESLWNLRNYGQPYRIDSETLGEPGLAGADIGILEAWKIQETAPEVTVAVIDGGFDLRHPDLAKAFAAAGGAYDFVRDRPGIEPPGGGSVVSHGTMVAGVIGAEGYNRIGITGIARRIRILAIEAVPEDGNEDDRVIAKAILYAIDRGARVINCSFGKYSTSTPVRAALESARRLDVLVVAGAGNDGRNVDKKPHWPSSYSTQFDNVVSVAATDRRDHIWPDSNYGLSVDLSAPGHEILSTGSPRDRRTRYMSFSGTSAAAPHVAAVAALMIAHHPAIRARELKQALLEGVDPLPALQGKVRSGGRLNAAKALSAAEALRRGIFSGGRKVCGRDLGTKRILAKNKYGYTAAWNLRNSPALHQPFEDPDPPYLNYRSWVRSHTSWTAQEILRNHLDIVRQAVKRLSPNDPFVLDAARDERNVGRILKGQLGRIRPMTCLESLPFREFLDTVDLREHSMEMDSTILGKGEELTVIGAFYFNPEAQDGAAGAAEPAEAAFLRRKMTREGWALLAHYHNHPFNFDNPYGDIGGILAPSDPDVETYLTLSPRQALISNGLDTLEIGAADFPRFELP